MTSSTRPEGAGSTREPKGDARTRLFTLQVDLFVNAPARDRESIRAFEALALGFMPRLDPGALAKAAERLAPCPDTPPAVLDFLVRFSARARAAILARAAELPPGVADLFIGLGRGAALAGRPGLDAALQERLVAMEEPAIDEALAGNARIALSPSILDALVARAVDRPLLGRALLARGDLDPATEAALYLNADRTRRAAIRRRIETGSDLPGPLLPTVAPEERDALIAAAERGDVAAFAARLSAMLGLAAGTRWSFLRRDRQELLGLGLSALQVGEEVAARIVLGLHPAIAQSHRAAAIIEAAASVPPRTALILIEGILARAEADAAARPATRPALRTVPPAPPIADEPQRLAS